MRDYQAHNKVLQEGKRMAALFRITDPLWKALDAGHQQEAARLQGELQKLWQKDKDRRIAEEEARNRSCWWC